MFDCNSGPVLESIQSVDSFADCSGPVAGQCIGKGTGTGTDAGKGKGTVYPAGRGRAGLVNG